MSDTLKIFGTEFTGVNGFKAKDKNNNILTYIKGGEVDGNNLGYGTLVYQNASVDGDKDGTEINTGIDLSNIVDMTIAFIVSSNDFKSSGRNVFSNGMENPSATQIFQMWTWGNGEVRFTAGYNQNESTGHMVLSDNICEVCQNWNPPVPFVFTFENLNTTSPTCTAYGYYNDAVVSKTITGSTNNITFTNLYLFPLGLHSYSGSRTSSMELSNVRIYNSVLSQSEINSYITGAMS